MTLDTLIPVYDSTFPDTPVWGPLEVLTRDNPELMSCAMYVGQVTTPAGIGHAYKHADLRRTIYVLPELVAAYHYEHGTAWLRPFPNPGYALGWWQS